MSVGSVGIGRIARILLDATSTAFALAHRAPCPVAIIRASTETPTRDAGWIALTWYLVSILGECHWTKNVPAAV